MKYLDLSGLGYFWTKIKAYVLSLVSGKADDSGVVHKAGGEDVSGLKTFAGNFTGGMSGLVVKSNDIDRGSAPASNKFCSLNFVDKDFDVSSPDTSMDASRLASIDYAARQTGRVDFQFIVVNPDDSIGGDVRFRIGFDANGIPYFVGPSTKDNPGSDEIITYDWLPKDTRLVHTTGDETISGSKTFYNNLTIFSGSDPTAVLNNTVADRTAVPSNVWRWQVLPRDKNGVQFGTICWTSRASGTHDLRLDVANANGDYTYFYLGWDSYGRQFATAPSTNINRSGDQDIITRDWIPKDTRIVHTTGDESIGGFKTFNNVIAQHCAGRYGVTRLISDVVKGTLPSQSQIIVYGTFEKANTFYYANRISAFETIVDTDGSVYVYLIAYKFASGSSVAGNLLLVYPYNAESTAVYVRAPTIRPHATNTYSLGTGSYRWTNVYINAAAVSTSDERLKHNIKSVPDEVLDAWADLEWLQFQMLDSVQKKGVSGARIHTGAVAQRIDELFARHGLDASRYGLFCHDEWEQTKEVRGDDGEVRTPYQAAGDMYSLRYAEALCMEAAYMRRENARLKKRVADLEERLAALELKMS